MKETGLSYFSGVGGRRSDSGQRARTSMAPSAGRPSARRDALADALDYDAVARAAASFVAQARVQLVETLAERLAEALQRDFGVAWLRLELHKPGAVAGAADVSVAIERGKRP
jgi:7,8-dihydroneopterin aldolase/epimerase/oxygenase